MVEKLHDSPSNTAHRFPLLIDDEFDAENDMENLIVFYENVAEAALDDLHVPEVLPNFLIPHDLHPNYNLNFNPNLNVNPGLNVNLNLNVNEHIDVSEDEENPAVEENPALAESPALDENPTGEENPIREENPSREENPIREENPSREENPIREENSIREGNPIREENPIREGNPIREENPIREGNPILEENPTHEENPTPEENPTQNTENKNLVNANAMENENFVANENLIAEAPPPDGASNYVPEPIQNSTPNGEISNLGTIESVDLDSKTLELLKGDAIGDTVYSESFVAGTLLKLRDSAFTEDLENDLCSLWDMSTENDVCKYLFSLSYPKLATAMVLDNLDNIRLVEIMIGILGNMLCTKHNTILEDEELGMLLTTLSSEDAALLFQTVRCFRGYCYSMKRYTFIDGDFLRRILFILNNSLNKELLEETLHFACYINLKNVDVSCIDSTLLESACNGYRNLITDRNEVDTKEHMQALEYLFTIIANLTDYHDLRFDHCTSNETKTNLKRLAEDNSKTVSYLCGKIIKFYERNVGEILEGTKFKRFYNDINLATRSWLYNYNKKDFVYMLKTLYKLMKEKKGIDVDEAVELISLPLVDWVFRASQTTVRDDLLNCLSFDVVGVLKFILEKDFMDHREKNALSTLIVDLQGHMQSIR